MAKSSRFRGVSWAKWDRKWQAYIVVRGKMKHVGLFVNEEDAARARDVAWLEAGGNSARLNFPQPEASNVC